MSSPASPASPASPLLYFSHRHASFSTTLTDCRKQGELSETMFDEADAQFEARVTESCKGADPIACGRGCATCCSLRVTATAPEVLRVARHLRERVDGDTCVRLVRRLFEADGLTRDLDESERVALRHKCPFIDKAACVIYPVRPLACRGHASHSRKACVQAARGQIDSVPHSVAHRDARSLIQNALQSALRDTGLGWGAYELNHALRIALATPDAEARYLQGEDLFADAQVHEVPAHEMAEGFDLIKKMANTAVPAVRRNVAS
ncbi:YkgJ family cysteine cluster protein [Viridibacterium curvum]|uniref:YkgJ family cysteine cluster protein n=1 Tax=Viridibacterium curvum TaxID=1101404 RepID=A0ABP9R718_9RHOO